MNSLTLRPLTGWLPVILLCGGVTAWGQCGLPGGCGAPCGCPDNSCAECCSGGAAGIRCSGISKADKRAARQARRACTTCGRGASGGCGCDCGCGNDCGGGCGCGTGWGGPGNDVECTASSASRLFGFGNGCGPGGGLFANLRSGGGIGLCGCHSCDGGCSGGAAVHCGMPAPNYPCPHPTPKPTTWTELTYPPMMPHNSLPNYRGTYSYRHGPGLSRTTVMWTPSKLENAFDRLHNLVELPR